MYAECGRSVLTQRRSPAIGHLDAEGSVFNLRKLNCSARPFGSCSSAWVPQLPRLLDITGFHSSKSEVYEVQRLWAFPTDARPIRSAVSVVSRRRWLQLGAVLVAESNVRPRSALPLGGSKSNCPAVCDWFLRARCRGSGWVTQRRPPGLPAPIATLVQSSREKTSVRCRWGP